RSTTPASLKSAISKAALVSSAPRLLVTTKVSLQPLSEGCAPLSSSTRASGAASCAETGEAAAMNAAARMWDGRVTCIARSASKPKRRAKLQCHARLVERAAGCVRERVHICDVKEVVGAEVDLEVVVDVVLGEHV